MAHRQRIRSPFTASLHPQARHQDPSVLILGAPAIATNKMKPTEVIQLAKNHECRRLRLAYCDLTGAWRQRTLPISRLSEELFKTGLMLAAGLRPEDSKAPHGRLRIVPDPASARLGPLDNADALTMLCHVRELEQDASHPCDARSIARRAQQFLQASGIGDACHVGFASEFYLFNSVRYENTSTASYFSTQSPYEEAVQATTDQPATPFGGQLGTHQAECAGELCDAVMQALIVSGIDVSATGPSEGPGQSRIELGTSLLVESADRSLWLKRTVKHAARQLRKTATFMPVPLQGEKASQLGVNLRISKQGENIFFDSTSGKASDQATWFINGLLQHAPALCAFANASTNSYRRVLPPALQGTDKRFAKDASRSAFFAEARSAEKDIHAPFADASCNPYLTLSAMLLAGLDGILKQNKQPLPLPVPPLSLDEALTALAADHDFLLAGETFSKELIDRWIEQKRSSEVRIVHQQPVPQEYQLYYDC